MKPVAKRILLLTDDQHRFDAYGFTGAWGDLTTPVADRLRAEGTTLTHAMATCPICVPNRFTLCHGLLPSQGAAGLLRNAADWPMLPSLPGILREHGWKTALIGKLHSFHGDFGSDEHIANTRERGFDDVYEVGGRSLTYSHDCRWTRHLESKGLLQKYRDEIEQRRAHLCWEEPYRKSVVPYEDHMDVFIRRDAVRWIQQADEEQPFFLHVSLCGPHFPLDAPEGWFGKHDPASMPAPYAVDNPEVSAYWQEQRAAYADMIHMVDHEMGLVFDALEQRGWMDDTLIIYLSDHGDRMGDTGQQHKGKPEDGSARTPWFIRLPGVIPAGVSSDAAAATVDIAATCLAAAGIEKPLNELLPESPSVSWWEHLSNGADAPTQWVYSECGAWRMICNTNWKYIYYPEDGEERLHHRTSDPDDGVNLIELPDHQEIREEMRMILMNRITTHCIAPNTRAFYEGRQEKTAARKAIRDQWEHIPLKPTVLKPGT